MNDDALKKLADLKAKMERQVAISGQTEVAGKVKAAKAARTVIKGRNTVIQVKPGQYEIQSA